MTDRMTSETASSDHGSDPERATLAKDMCELARSHTWKAIDTLVSVMQDIDAPASSRVAAAITMLDRGWGKPLPAVKPDAGDDFAAVLRAADELSARRKARGS